MKPTLASGVKIDANILLKSIASSGAVYLQLFADDLDDPDDDWEFSTSLFNMPAGGSGVLEHSFAELTSMEPIHVPSNEVIDRRDGVNGRLEHFWQKTLVQKS